MKPATYNEGPEAFTTFTNAMQKILSAPKEELQRREAEYKRRSDAKPIRRGPKRKQP
jgi:hypothetical protein